MSKITPLLLCGGSGTRLWPLSRKAFPKQFTSLMGGQTLFQAAVQRVSGESYARPVIISNADFRFVVVEQLANARIEPGPILIEPSGRNTAPAILAGLMDVARRDPDGMVLVLPSDHVIPDPAAFNQAVAAGARAAAEGKIVTFGITPDRAETGYGWLELAAAPQELQATPLRRFVEKPDSARAAEMLAAGNYLWNAGIFLFSVKAGLKAFEAHAPQLVPAVRKALEASQTDLGFVRLAAEGWDAAEDISIDYAVMEKSRDLVVIPYAAGWSDLGDWGSVWRESPDRDEAGNAARGDVVLMGCSNSLVRAENAGQIVVGIGLKEMITVAMKDAVLVAPLSRAQDVKTAVAELKRRGFAQAENLPSDNRPWGWFETLALSDRFQVKRIVVKPGGILSLQSHFHRSEHWIVVSGTARVTIEDEVRLVTENQSVYIPLGARHRMENPGHVPMVLIEVQTGAYLGEDDIIRYDDAYARGQGAKG